MTVLVTGGTGFVGLNVVEQLAAEGHDIVALGHAAPPWHLPEPTRRRAEIVVGDVRSVDALEEALILAERSARFRGNQDDLARIAELRRRVRRDCQHV